MVARRRRRCAGVGSRVWTRARISAIRVISGAVRRKDPQLGGDDQHRSSVEGGEDRRGDHEREPRQQRVVAAEFAAELDGFRLPIEQCHEHRIADRLDGGDDQDEGLLEQVERQQRPGRAGRDRARLSGSP